MNFISKGEPTNTFEYLRSILPIIVVPLLPTPPENIGLI